MKTGSWNGRQELNQLLPNKPAPPVVKSVEHTPSKTIKNKGYEGWKLKNAGVEIISNKQFEDLKAADPKGIF